jgi:outer membrane receptor for ferrienterochelin and colicins
MKFLLILAIMLSGIIANAQLRGVVVDKSSQEVLPSAVVIWEGTRLGTTTNEQGEFSISIPPEAKSIIIAMIGYVSDTLLYKGENFVRVELLAINTSTAGANVIGDKAATRMTMRNPQNFQVIDKKELCKAACCNLSESFETNASIDATFADAITGTKQIKMLGLDGKYTQIMFDNIPAVRGLASTYGLTYVPGPWINSIYIAKGIGSVTSGFESMTGQINVAHKSPDTAERLHINLYGGNAGRMELNVVWRPSMRQNNPDGAQGSKRRSIHFQPVFLVHGAYSSLRFDHNKDGFLDNPLFSNLLLRNEWHLESEKGLGGQYTISYMHLTNTAGKRDYDPKDEIRSKLWGVDMTTDRYEFSGKTGFVFSEKEWKSFGSQVNVSWQDQNGKYGFREYSGQQLSARVNLLFASRIINDNHKITSGASYQFDDYRERIYFKSIPPVSLSSQNLNRREMVPGVFGEYTLNWKEKCAVIAGIRADYHNIYKLFFTPRLHVRYSFNELSTIKLVAGKGYRTANILMDNVGMLASNRDIILQGNDPKGIYGMKMESAWNFGLIYSKKFKLNHRDGTLSIDAYRTQFVNQVVMDMEQPEEVRFYNLNGKSYSNSAQAEFHWSPARRLEWRLAYRWLEVKTDYTSGLLDKPLLNKHRAFTNLAFSTKEKSRGSLWRFDGTLQWVSSKRIPHTEHQDHDAGDGSTYSQDYFQLNAQVTYVIRKDFEIYIGGENLTNFMVHNPIISAENPDSQSFDGSLIWGPVFGRMGYVGLRWSLN